MNDSQFNMDWWTGQNSVWGQLGPSGWNKTGGDIGNFLFGSKDNLPGIQGGGPRAAPADTLNASLPDLSSWQDIGKHGIQSLGPRSLSGTGYSTSDLQDLLNKQTTVPGVMGIDQIIANLNTQSQQRDQVGAYATGLEGIAQNPIFAQAQDILNNTQGYVDTAHNALAQTGQDALRYLKEHVQGADTTGLSTDLLRRTGQTIEQSDKQIPLDITNAMAPILQGQAQIQAQAAAARGGAPVSNVDLSPYYAQVSDYANTVAGTKQYGESQVAAGQNTLLNTLMQLLGIGTQATVGLAPSFFGQGGFFNKTKTPSQDNTPAYINAGANVIKSVRG